MLAARTLRLAGVRCVRPAQGIWFKNVKTQPIVCLNAFYSKDVKNTGTVEDDLKLPTKTQVESFVFKSIVYCWDFTYYIFRLFYKLFNKYVVHNSIVQQNWKQLQRRMDDARKELKQK